MVSKSWKYQETDSPLKSPESTTSLQILKPSETHQNSDLQKYNKFVLFKFLSVSFDTAPREN